MRIPLTVCFALLAAARGPAEEKPAAQTTPVEDPIAAAKRDFDTVKASRDRSVQPKSDLPRLGLPELQMNPAEPRPWTARKSLTPEKKSANWLVEAMEKKTDLRKERPGHRESDRSPLASSEEEGEEKTSELKPSAARGEAGSSFDKEKKELDPTLNPLTRFLAGWMTPQDYALLKPGLQGSRPGESSPRSEARVSPFAGELSAIVAPDIAFGLAGTNKPAFVPPTPQENPYLQALNAPISPPSTSFPALAPSPASPARIPAPTISSPPAVPAPGQAKIPEFAKPSTDDKYFKPLKRF